MRLPWRRGGQSGTLVADGTEGLYPGVRVLAPGGGDGEDAGGERFRLYRFPGESHGDLRGLPEKPVGIAEDQADDRRGAE